ncbi:regulatory helix-turn-helix LysR family protein [Rhizobium sp. ERR 1071]|nr:regulatory helix-turn-helix LysR family protein [Rhizobium sp. ERR1071]
MRRKIPSNSALLAFEASARHGSFARAADELALTEGAISRQISRLEAFLGVTLFERVGNRVRLLPNGERYALQVRESLDRLERDSQYLMGQSPMAARISISPPSRPSPRAGLFPVLGGSAKSTRILSCISPNGWSLLSLLEVGLMPRSISITLPGLE